MPQERDDFDELDEFDDLDEAGDAGQGIPPHWPEGGYPPPPPPGAGRGRRRAGLLALIAVVAAAGGFGVVAVAMRDVAPSPAAGSSPSASAPSTGAPGGGAGTQLPPQSGGGAIPSTGPGEEMHLEIGGRVTAVSATSITLGGGGQPVTAAVTSATKVTGKVTSIEGVKVGDLVSAMITGTDGKLTADSVQDPASMP